MEIVFQNLGTIYRVLLSLCLAVEVFNFIKIAREKPKASWSNTRKRVLLIKLLNIATFSIMVASKPFSTWHVFALGLISVVMVFMPCGFESINKNKILLIARNVFLLALGLWLMSMYMNQLTLVQAIR